MQKHFGTSTTKTWEGNYNVLQHTLQHFILINICRKQGCWVLKHCSYKPKLKFPKKETKIKKTKTGTSKELLGQLNICDNKCNKTEAHEYATKITIEVYGF